MTMFRAVTCKGVQDRKLSEHSGQQHARAVLVTCQGIQGGYLFYAGLFRNMQALTVICEGLIRKMKDSNCVQGGCLSECSEQFPVKCSERLLAGCSGQIFVRAFRQQLARAFVLVFCQGIQGGNLSSAQISYSFHELMYCYLSSVQKSLKAVFRAVTCQSVQDRKLSEHLGQ